MKVKYATMIVADMDESIAFYRDVMGFEVDRRFDPSPGVSITMLKGEGDAMVELIKNPDDAAGLHSVGMEVADLSATLEELKAKGATITRGPVETTGGSLAFMEDPNGVRITLIQHG